MDTKNWKYFSMRSLFKKFERGKVHSQDSLPEGDNCIYVGAKKDRCGFMSKCGYDKSMISKGNCIVFICNGEGSVGYCNYIDRDFMASGDLILAYADFINPYTALFIVTLLDRERPKYSFGRKYGKYVKETLIPLPVTKDGNEPDWDRITHFVETHLFNKLPEKAQKLWENCYEREPVNDIIVKLTDREWKPRSIISFCEPLYKATAYNAIELQPCSSNTENSIPYITRTGENNSCKFYVQKTGDIKDVEKGNAITIGDTTATISYQAQEFICGDHIVVLRSRHFNKYTGLFIVTLLNKERFRYNYGRAFKLNIIEDTFLQLPVIPNTDDIDWQYMEDYIKSLPYSKNI